MDWQVTATSVYCDFVADEVTIIVHKDWSVKCTGYSRYGKPDKVIRNRLKKKSRQMGWELKCDGLQCRPITQYKEKLSKEEAAKSSQTGKQSK